MIGFLQFIHFVAALFTIAASGIAIYLFVFKRRPILIAFRLLLNYSQQLSLGDLRLKIDRLSELKYTNAEQRVEIENILHEILGQIRGNKKLEDDFASLARKINKHFSSKTMTEANKRAVVSELRERLRHLEVKNLDGLLGE